MEKLAHQKPHPSRGMEVIHIRAAVGIDPRQQRHNIRQLAEVIPVDDDPGRAGNGNEMQRVIRGAARRQQANNGIDHRTFVHDPGDRYVFLS